MTNDKNSEKFLKVIYDRMTDAQAEIKANYSVTAGDALTNTNTDDSKEELSQHETKARGKKSVLILLFLLYFCISFNCFTVTDHFCF